LIVLDTNIVSEMMRTQPNKHVMKWLDDQKSGDLWLTAVNTAELMLGVARLPKGARKSQLASALATTLDEDFSGRILPFDTEAAAVYADLAVQREAIGRTGSIADTQIAAICLVHGATFATRNVKDFEAMGLVLINPWVLSEPS
jgi:toxin FitB